MTVENKHFLFITSTNLSCNPRCLKEVKLLCGAKANISVVAFKLQNWTDAKEIEIRAELKNVDFYYLETSKKKIFQWFLGVFLEKSSRSLATYFPSIIWLQAISVSKRSWNLLRWVKTYNKKIDFIIAHNPAAFYPAYWLAKKMKTQFALDIEDYHPGEKNSKVVNKSLSFLMMKLMPLAAYNSFASPLIATYSAKLVENEKIKNPIVINNLFPASEFSLDYFDINNERKLQLVWFSQFIDYGRGLENLLPALDKRSEEITLTLIGNVRENFFVNELQNRNYIKVIPAVSQKELNKQLGKFDVGLAIEDATNDLNRDICLTNKIWSYFQAGLYILASDTLAQQQFLQKFPSHGSCTSFTKEALDKSINTLFDLKMRIRLGYAKRFSNAATHNWETESLTLQSMWKQVMK